MSTIDPSPPGTAATLQGRGRVGDRIFSGTATAAGAVILLMLAAVAMFLVVEGIPAMTADADEIPGGKNIAAFVGPLLFGTVFAAVIALVIAAPLAIGIALFISHYAPPRVASTLGYLVDLLAAVPSVVYGLWGIFFLADNLRHVYPWLHDHLGFLPFFSAQPSTTGRTMLTVGIALAVMIMPIMTAVNREVFLQTPRLQEEAALALGATKFEMIRMTVLPFSRSGIMSGAMLGLGRAMGETIAVAMILSAYPDLVSVGLIGAENSSTVAANIALKFPEYHGIEVNALIASGLALFVLTFVVNFGARAIIARRSEFSGADA